MIRRAFAFSALQRYTELAIQVGSMVVLARLIAPDEFGVFVAGAAVLTLAWTIGDFGQQDFLIQQREPTRERRAVALGLSLAASAACALAIVGALLLLPEAAVDPRLRAVLLVLMIALLARPFTIAITALLQREMRFAPVFAIGVLQVAMTASVAIALAAQGFGAQAVAWGTVAGALAALGCALLIVGRAGLTSPRLRGWRGVFRFGSMRMAASGLAQIGDAGSMLTISQLLGFAATGLVDRGQRISGLFDHGVMEAVKPVVLPVLAQHRRSNGDLKQVYLRKLAYVSALAWPFFGFTAMFAEPIVALLLGPMWTSIVPIVQILCLRGLFTPLTNLNAKFYIALDMLPTFLRRQTILQPAKLVLVGLAALVSVELVAVALVGDQLLKAALDLGPLKRHLSYAPRQLVDRMAGSALVTAASLAPVIGLFAVYGTPRASDLGFLFGGAALATLGWIIGVLVSRHPLADEVWRALWVARGRHAAPRVHG